MSKVIEEKAARETKKAAKIAASQNEVTYAGGLRIMWPPVSNFAGIAPRHLTIGQADTCLEVSVYDSINDKTGDINVVRILLERIKPPDRKTRCRHQSSAIKSVWARMLALGCETLKGVDSMTARIAAVTFALNYEPLCKSAQLGMLFNDRGHLPVVVWFPSSKQTPSGWGREDAFPVFSTLGEIRHTALLLATVTLELDERTNQKPRQAVKEKVGSLVEFELDF